MYTSTPPLPATPATPATPDTGNFTMQHNNQSTRPQNTSGESIPPETASTLKRQANGPILWFANPPMNVLPLANTPVHSVAYLNWKAQQEQQENQSDNMEN